MPEYVTKIINIFSNLDKLDLKIMKIGLKLSYAIIIFSTCLLAINLLFIHIYTFYNFGIFLIKTSLYFGVSFIICGIVVDGIKNKDL